MNSLIINPQYQPFETPIEAKGRQYIGYLDLSSLIQSSCGKLASFCLIDVKNQSLQFSISQPIWLQIQQQIKAMHIDSMHHLYIWIEVNTNFEVVNSRIFQAMWNLPQMMTIFQSCYHFESLYQLLKVTQSLTMQSLIKFIHEVFLDINLMTLWVSLPASKQHHHSYPGGLLAHSLECALIAEQNVGMLTELSVKEKEVTVLAALLHDIGKTQTLGMQSHTSTGRLLDHEKLTLTTIGVPLAKLEQLWPQGSETLRYLLTWNISMGFCRFIGGNILKIADHLSTSASLRRMAFKDKPNYFHFAELQVGSKPQYLNRLP